VLNEFFAFKDLAGLKPHLDPLSFTIRDVRPVRLREHQLGGHSDRRHRRARPDRKHDLARLGFRAMIAGTLANFLSATLAGILL